MNLEIKEWNSCRHHCCVQKESGSEERHTSDLRGGRCNEGDATMRKCLS